MPEQLYTSDGTPATEQQIIAAVNSIYGARRKPGKLTTERRAQIKRLHSSGVPAATIAKQLQLSRTTVIKALKLSTAP